MKNYKSLQISEIPVTIPFSENDYSNVSGQTDQFLSLIYSLIKIYEINRLTFGELKEKIATDSNSLFGLLFLLEHEKFIYVSINDKTNITIEFTDKGHQKAQFLLEQLKTFNTDICNKNGSGFTYLQGIGLSFF